MRNVPASTPSMTKVASPRSASPRTSTSRLDTQHLLPDSQEARTTGADKSRDRHSCFAWKAAAGLKLTRSGKDRRVATKQRKTAFAENQREYYLWRAVPGVALIGIGAVQGEWWLVGIALAIVGIGVVLGIRGRRRNHRP